MPDSFLKCSVTSNCGSDAAFYIFTSLFIQQQHPLAKVGQKKACIRKEMIAIGKRYTIELIEDCSSAAIYRAAIIAAGRNPETTAVLDGKKILVSQHIFDANVSYRMRRYRNFSMPRELWAMHGLRVSSELKPNKVEIHIGFFEKN